MWERGEILTISTPIFYHFWGYFLFIYYTKYSEKYMPKVQLDTKLNMLLSA